jgi:hypothetical protein
MPYNYNDTSVLNGNVHTVTLVTPLVKEPSSSVDYNEIKNKPSINGVELVGDLSFEELGIQPAGDYASEPLSAEDVDRIIDSLE